MPEGLKKAALTDGFRALGLEAGDEVLVHSSLSSLGRVDGGARTVVDALVEAVGSDGTVLAPTLTGSAKLGPDFPPAFDPDHTPCWTGAIPEALRKDPRSRRSLHPTHSVAAIGRAAEEILRDHELSPTPCGRETPYLRLASESRRGRMLFIGVDFSCCTTFHGVEEEAHLPYHLQRGVTPARISVVGGQRIVHVRLHYYGPRRDFCALEPLIQERKLRRTGVVGKARCTLVETRRIVKLALENVRRDPEFLLARSEKGKGWGDGRRLPEI